MVTLIMIVLLIMMLMMLAIVIKTFIGTNRPQDNHKPKRNELGNNNKPTINKEKSKKETNKRHDVDNIQRLGGVMLSRACQTNVDLRECIQCMDIDVRHGIATLRAADAASAAALAERRALAAEVEAAKVAMQSLGVALREDDTVLAILRAERDRMGPMAVQAAAGRREREDARVRNSRCHRERVGSDSAPAHALSCS